MHFPVCRTTGLVDIPIVSHRAGRQPCFQHEPIGRVVIWEIANKPRRLLTMSFLKYALPFLALGGAVFADSM